MTQNIFIGVDGGGTKCKVRVEDAQNHLLGKAKGGPTQIGINADTSWDNMLAAVKQALLAAGLSLTDSNYQFHIGLGLAGTEIETAAQKFLAKPHSFATLCLKSDAYTACLGAHGGKDGAIINIGTGVIGWRIQGEESLRISGWGFPHGDEGSAARIGLEAVRLTMHAYDGRAEFSPLLKTILQKFDNDVSKLIDWAVHGKSTQFSQITPLVIEHVDKKDKWALSLIKRAAKEIDILFEVLEKQAKDKKTKLPYSLFGGLAQFIEPWLSDSLRARLVTQQYDAVKGAIFMIKKQCQG